jgi:hypothetical protein
MRRGSQFPRYPPGPGAPRFSGACHSPFQPGTGAAEGAHWLVAARWAPFPVAILTLLVGQQWGRTRRIHIHGTGRAAIGKHVIPMSAVIKMCLIAACQSRTAAPAGDASARDPVRPESASPSLGGEFAVEPGGGHAGMKYSGRPETGEFAAFLTSLVARLGRYARRRWLWWTPRFDGATLYSAPLWCCCPTKADLGVVVADPDRDSARSRGRSSGD